MPVIVLKGAALAETIYPNIAHRPMGDADLLVRPEDQDQARAALEAAGYRFLPEPQQRFSPFDTEFTGEMAFRRIVAALSWSPLAGRTLPAPGLAEAPAGLPLAPLCHTLAGVARSA